MPTNPFDKIENSPVWDEFLRQEAIDPKRINLTDMWRTAGRPRAVSPKGWSRKYPWYAKSVILEGKTADGPAWADNKDALTYAKFLDDRIMEAAAEAFCGAMRADPAGMMMNAPDGAKPGAAFFALAANAKGGNTESVVRKIMSAVVERTADLDPYAQETEVARVQRAFMGGPTIGGDN
jgi:hypothetical protein